MEKLLFDLGNNIYPKPASATGEIPHPSAPSSSLSPTLAGFCIYLPRLGNSSKQEQDQWRHHWWSPTGLDPVRSQCNSLLQLLQVQRKPSSFPNKMGLYPSLRGCSCFWKGENMSLSMGRKNVGIFKTQEKRAGGEQ